ncbi:MAG: hypothetical protein Ct9H300mP12_01100 [Acidimicrobiales bacterium]|nr:MAG: hypothetical protein Ct9H300mP12_01100 [Acidimicrobiales bacterium]
MLVDGETAVLGALEWTPGTALIEVDGNTGRGAARPRSLRPEQAGWGGDHGRRPPRADPRWWARCPKSRGSSRWGAPDVDTEGLLLLTNDGELAHRLTHPSYGVEKEYVAEVEGFSDPCRSPGACGRAWSWMTARRPSPCHPG